MWRESGWTESGKCIDHGRELPPGQRIAHTTDTGGCITLESVLGDNPGRAGRTARVCETRLKLTRGDTITCRRRRLSSDPVLL